MKSLSVVLAWLVLSSLLPGGSVVTPKDDQVLGRYMTGDLTFERLEVGNVIVYRHQRTIDGAIVEGDFILLQVDKKTGELIKKKIHWRDDVPTHVTVRVSERQARSMVPGQEVTAKLYIISPQSAVFPITPPPRDPCWVVRSRERRKTVVTVIDAVTGSILGHGVPPPPAGAPP